MYKKISGLVVSLTAVFACAAWAEVPAGYPADYQKTIDAAVKEGKVVIYSTTDTKAAGPLIKVLRGILGKWKLTDRVLVNWLSPNTPPPSPCCRRASY